VYPPKQGGFAAWFSGDQEDESLFENCVDALCTHIEKRYGVGAQM
jgi:hypothetical protein